MKTNKQNPRRLDDDAPSAGTANHSKIPFAGKMGKDEWLFGLRGRCWTWALCPAHIDAYDGGVCVGAKKESCGQSHLRCEICEVSPVEYFNPNNLDDAANWAAGQILSQIESLAHHENIHYQDVISSISRQREGREIERAHERIIRTLGY